jgi:hypothetical protein
VPRGTPQQLSSLSCAQRQASDIKEFLKSVPI